MIPNIRHISFWCLLFCLLAGPTKLYAQYGLGFSSHEVIQDKRTGLDLNIDKQFCFREDFELSFDLSFMPNKSDYFGYVVRIISNDQKNIDLLYDRRDNTDKHFKIVIGEKFSRIAFNIDSNQLYGDWNRVTIKLDAAAQSLTFRWGEYVFTESVDIEGGSCLKILFGHNNYQDFKTTDVPSMKVHDVRIRQGNRLMHHWPLDEVAGNWIKDEVQGTTAVVHNPQWIKRSYYEWEQLHEIKIGGQASVAFDPKTESVYFVGRDSLVQVRAATAEKSALNYSSGQLALVNGNQSFFDTVGNRLLNICIDQKTVSTFDFSSGRWSHNFDYPGLGTNYLHFNKFYSAADSSLYFVDGYGHFLFKNEIQRYNLVTGKWYPVNYGGDEFTPRYLSALGATADGAYVLGGYGSATGQQMLNPKNLYDLLFFDQSTGTFTKQYVLTPENDDYVWANSLIVDEAENRYYGLTFPKQKYHSGLQLVSGQLTQPSLQTLGNEIPYLFHDIHSFADLFYCPDSRRLIVVTLYHNVQEDVTTAKVYSLYSPPLPFITAKVPAPPNRLSYYTGLILLFGAGLFFLIYKIRKKKSKEVANSDAPVVELADEPIQVPAAMEVEKPKSCLFLFGGDMQLFDASETDITRNFTPLVKELFLVVLLHTIRWGRGISSEKLTEQFWFDKSTNSARNNRSVNIAKINSILEKVGDAKISKETGYWRCETDSSIFIDYQSFLAIVTNKDPLDKARVKELSMIVQRGGFLSETDYEWLDSFKEEVSIQVINTYMRYAENAKVEDDPEFMIELANNIFFFDPVHEEAMIIKCKALAFLGNHSLAIQTFESFCAEYRQIYVEEFDMDYKSVLS